MRFPMLQAAAVAAACLIATAFGGTAQAQNVPSGAVKVYLKDHPTLPLAASEDGARLTADHHLWRLVAVEALQGLGAYQLVHDDSGRCLSADTGGGGETAPVFLIECADAISWELVFDPLPSHSDFRFVTADGYFLGLADGSDAEEGAEVLAVKPETGASRHFQEWLFEAPPVNPPSSPPPSSPAPSESPSVPAASESPKPTLPTTGAGLGLGIGGGAVALAGGAALVLWWQRRRALRSDW
ncbi:RICIN domain-containing protein [Glycomyces tritici]|uniref:Ricin B lectin domain-containing protein n=1 Tax=Glycomyces tritici TaxID=2665176 RepID=A0ABT7YJC3_9ACTN|nr:hypothetical protein [Glycomyces tritici]MDN3238703.1 hypothetical protein [Glycomyces tritici]